MDWRVCKTDGENNSIYTRNISCTRQMRNIYYNDTFLSKDRKKNVLKGTKEKMHLGNSILFPALVFILELKDLVGSRELFNYIYLFVMEKISRNWHPIFYLCMQYIFYRGLFVLALLAAPAVSQGILGISLIHTSNGTWKTSMLSAFSQDLWKSAGSPSYENNDLYQSQYFGLLMYRHHLTVRG